MVTKRHEILAYQFQVIASVTTNILRDVPVCHPFGNHREPPILEGVRNADKSEDVGVGQVLPHGNLFTEALLGYVSAPG